MLVVLIKSQNCWTKNQWKSKLVS